MEHEWFVAALKKFETRITRFSVKHTLQAASILDKFDIQDATLWRKVGKRVLFQLHKYKSNQLAQVLNIFSRQKVASNNK